MFSRFSFISNTLFPSSAKVVAILSFQVPHGAIKTLPQIYNFPTKSAYWRIVFSRNRLETVVDLQLPEIAGRATISNLGLMMRIVSFSVFYVDTGFLSIIVRISFFFCSYHFVCTSSGLCRCTLFSPQSKYCSEITQNGFSLPLLVLRVCLTNISSPSVFQKIPGLTRLFLLIVKEKESLKEHLPNTLSNKL